MQVLENLEKFTEQRRPLVLTIGNFDGMHRGHCIVLKQVKNLAEKEGMTTVITFRNHPSEILKPEQPTKCLCTLAHKLRLLHEFAIDKVLLLPFTRHLAQRSAASFIENIQKHIPFTHLVLGHDATLGRDKQGDHTTLQKLGEEWGFNVITIQEYRYNGQIVSSTRIREALRQGNFLEVEELMGRPYSIYSSVIKGAGKGKKMGFPTVNFDVSGLCLPPYGVYAVEILHGTRVIQGIANLGLAPTVRSETAPLLEVHLFDENQDLYGNFLEVFFKYFVRPEQKFHNIEELAMQIKRDIEFVKTSLSGPR